MELEAGIYNILVKLTNKSTTNKKYFTPEEICEIPVSEGFCGEGDIEVCLKRLKALGRVQKNSQGKYKVSDMSKGYITVKYNETWK